jgi:hypothetical protein
MKINTSEMMPPALNWAVAKCLPDDEFLFSPHPYLPDENGQPAWFNPSTNWAQGGPIIEREWIEVVPWPNESDEDMRWRATQHDLVARVSCTGPTPLIAAMRCYVASKLDHEVEVPEELNP